MPLYEVEEVHHLILFDAADIANRELSELGFVGPEGQMDLGDTLKEHYNKTSRVLLESEIFRADPVQSEKGGLCLSIDPVVYATIPDDIKGEVHRIGKSAIKQALIKNQKQLVGLILGEARQGRNYFDRFEPSDQGRLF